MRTDKPADLRVLFRSTTKIAFCTACVVAIALSTTVAYAQQGRQQLPQTTEPSKILFASSENYRIGNSDVIEVQVEKAPELSGLYVVSAEGNFPMKYLGSMRAQGKTVEELGNEIADNLRGRYLKDPQVTVAVRQYNSRTFFIQGAVKLPGSYVIVGKPSVFTLINLAGGLEREHGSTAFVMRKIKNDNPEVQISAKESGSEENQPQEEYELLKADVSRIFEGNFGENVLLEPGDTVLVPPADVCFIAGEIAKPSSIPLQRGLTLRQAIILAGGPTGNAKKSDAYIVRKNPEGGEDLKIEVNIGDVMKAEKADILLQANDYIFIPNNKMKSIGRALLNMGGIGWIRFPGIR